MQNTKVKKQGRLLRWGDLSACYLKAQVFSFLSYRAEARVLVRMEWKATLTKKGRVQGSNACVLLAGECGGRLKTGEPPEELSLRKVC